MQLRRKQRPGEKDDTNTDCLPDNIHRSSCYHATPYSEGPDLFAGAPDPSHFSKPVGFTTTSVQTDPPPPSRGILSLCRRADSGAPHILLKEAFCSQILPR